MGALRLKQLSTHDPTKSVQVLEINADSSKESDSSDEDTGFKAVKHDDAEVNIHKWNLRLTKGLKLIHTKKYAVALDIIRRLVLQRLKRKMTQSFFGWLHSQKDYKSVGIAMNNIVSLKQIATPQELQQGNSYVWTTFGRSLYIEWCQDRNRRHRKDLHAGHDSIRRVADGDWWQWSKGLRPAHWRWPEWYQEIIRDGLPIWFKYSPTFWTKPQHAPKSKEDMFRLR